MILRVWSSLPTFREVVLTSGINVILADQGDESGDKESRNGLGKTTLLRVIHFCLGSDFSREKVLNHPKLHGFDFNLDLNIKEHLLSVSRNTADWRHIKILKGAENFPELAKYSDLIGTTIVNVSTWNELLGQWMFGIDEASREASISFRGLIGYFARLGKQAFTDPFDYVGKQKAWQKRTQVAYLLGLNWQLTHQWHVLQKQEEDVRNVVKAVSAAERSGGFQTSGDLHARRVALDVQIDSKKSDLTRFRITDNYRQIEFDLNAIDRSLNNLINENHSDQRVLEHYLAGVNELDHLPQSSASSILRDAGAVFREDALRDIEDVADFHRQVYENRLAFLESEIERLRTEIYQREVAIAGHVDRKNQLLNVLSSGGALDTFLVMQDELHNLTAERESISARLGERRRYDQFLDEIDLQLSQLKMEARSDFDERTEYLDQIRRIFAQYTGSLYEKPGLMIVDLGASGLKFDVAIDREGSDGVDQMVVFCFDLLLANLWQSRSTHPGFLMHDSTIFADVDARQKTRALMLAAQESERLGFQYLCCLNTDTLPVEDFEQFGLNDRVRLRLSDSSAETRLLGLDLPPHEPIE